MTTPRTAHRRTSGSIRHLSSGSRQARCTGPDGALRTLGTFPTKVEADQALAHETSRMARGLWHDPSRGQEQLGRWFREWIAGRADLADRTRALYERLLETAIDAPLSLERPNGAVRVCTWAPRPSRLSLPLMCASGTPRFWRTRPDARRRAGIARGTTLCGSTPRSAAGRRRTARPLRRRAGCLLRCGRHG